MTYEYCQFTQHPQVPLTIFPACFDFARFRVQPRHGRCADPGNAGQQARCEWHNFCSSSARSWLPRLTRGEHNHHGLTCLNDKGCTAAAISSWTRQRARRTVMHDESPPFTLKPEWQPFALTANSNAHRIVLRKRFLQKEAPDGCCRRF